ncbi:MAG: DsbA family protein [Acidimicrobiales bacterium]
MTATRPDSVAFHFDPMCPYAYQTSRWIRSVRDETGLRIEWRFFSLEEVNRVEGRKHPWEREWSYGWSLMRIGARLRRDGMDALDAWYAAIGAALHEQGRKPHDPEVARAILADLGFAPGLVDEALADPTTHDEVRAEHRKVIDAGGYGVPSLFFPADGSVPGDGSSTGEQMLFGPVLIDPPAGAAAVRLWDAVTAWLEFPDLFELQRPKSPDAERRIAATFRPYLEARDWISINRGVEVAITDDGFAAVGPADRPDGP